LAELDFREKIVLKGISMIKYQKLMIENSLKKSINSDLSLAGAGLGHLGLKRDGLQIDGIADPRLAEGKSFAKVRDMILPYNSFFGISNDLKCLANKQDNLPLESLL
jgi:hypothetical protein